MESKQTLIFRLYQVLSGYSDADHPLTQQKIIDILSNEYDLVVERKAIGRNVSYLKEMGFEIEGDKKESILQAALSRTRNSVFLSTAF